MAQTDLEKDKEVRTASQKATTGRLLVIHPRLSEKAAKLATRNQYVFTVETGANKIEIRKALEKFYGIKVDKVNIVRVEGKERRYGRTKGRMSDFKKAIVTLSENSKKPDFFEVK